MKTFGKFRVLEGKHQEGGVLYRRGEVVDSACDLVKRCNTRVSKKFERVPDDTLMKQEEESLDAERVEKAEENEVSDQFTGMTIAELRDLAADPVNRIDLKGATKKEDILEILRRHVLEV